MAEIVHEKMSKTSFGDADTMTDKMRLEGKCSNRQKLLMCCEEKPHKRTCKVRNQVQEVKSISVMKRTLNTERKRFSISGAVLLKNVCSNCVSVSCFLFVYYHMSSISFSHGNIPQRIRHSRSQWKMFSTIKCI